jgi:putative spermidine/putrescine transport system ATP-binding protein
MQEELQALQARLGITFVFVTHDQGEALSMANRVAIFNDGKIVQVGTPSDVYERPNSRFVADFVGSSNILSPEFAAAHGGRAVWTSLRPEKIEIASVGALVPAACAGATGVVGAISYQGAVTRVTVAADKVSLVAAIPAGAPFGKGDSVALIWPKSAMMAMEGNA